MLIEDPDYANKFNLTRTIRPTNDNVTLFKYMDVSNCGYGSNIGGRKLVFPNRSSRTVDKFGFIVRAFEYFTRNNITSLPTNPRIAFNLNFVFEKNNRIHHNVYSRRRRDNINNADDVHGLTVNKQFEYCRKKMCMNNYSIHLFIYFFF